VIALLPSARPSRSEAMQPALAEFAVSGRVSVESDVAHMLCQVMHLCTRLGLGRIASAHVATAASELANNLWMHADGGGWLYAARIVENDRVAVELVAEDSGPGIVDIGLAMCDGYSTGGGLGCGLPGVARLMDWLDVRSVPGQGTRVRALKWC